MSEEESRQTHPEPKEGEEGAKKVKPGDLTQYSNYTSRDLKAKKTRLSKLLKEMD